MAMQRFHATSPGAAATPLAQRLAAPRRWQHAAPRPSLCQQCWEVRSLGARVPQQATLLTRAEPDFHQLISCECGSATMSRLRNDFLQAQKATKLRAANAAIAIVPTSIK
jgi:hypothetical protein